MLKDRSQLCARLRQGRKEAGLKQETVARYLEIPVSAVSALEAGSRKIDALELYMLSKLYEKPITWFFVQEDANRNTIRPPSNHNNAEPDLTEDPLVIQCIQMIRTAPPTLQRSAAYGIIGFLKSN